MMLERSEHSEIFQRAESGKGLKTEEVTNEGHCDSVCRLNPKLGVPLFAFAIGEQLIKIHLSDLRYCRGLFRQATHVSKGR